MGSLNPDRSSMIIAIDGPAASGKGTIARQIAAVYGLHHLDTGLLYRAVAKAVLDAGYSPSDVAHAIDAAIALDPAKFDDNALKLQAITEAASVVAAIPEVRQALMSYQRQFATGPPGASVNSGRAAKRPMRKKSWPTCCGATNAIPGAPPRR